MNWESRSFGFTDEVIEFMKGEMSVGTAMFGNLKPPAPKGEGGPVSFEKTPRKLIGFLNHFSKRSGIGLRLYESDKCEEDYKLSGHQFREVVYAQNPYGHFWTSEDSELVMSNIDAKIVSLIYNIFMDIIAFGIGLTSKTQTGSAELLKAFSSKCNS